MLPYAAQLLSSHPAHGSTAESCPGSIFEAITVACHPVSFYQPLTLTTEVLTAHIVLRMCRMAAFARPQPGSATPASGTSSQTASWRMCCPDWRPAWPSAHMPVSWTAASVPQPSLLWSSTLLPGALPFCYLHAFVGIALYLTHVEIFQHQLCNALRPHSAPLGLPCNQQVACQPTSACNVTSLKRMPCLLCGCRALSHRCTNRFTPLIACPEYLAAVQAILCVNNNVLTAMPLHAAAGRLPAVVQAATRLESRSGRHGCAAHPRGHATNSTSHALPVSNGIRSACSDSTQCAGSCRAPSCSCPSSCAPWTWHWM